MRRTLVAVLAAAAVVVVLAAPVGAREFGHIYANGDTYRTFVVPANVPPGSGTDPLYGFTNSEADGQYSVARYANGRGSHGGRWQVWNATWTDSGDPTTLVTSAAQLDALVASGQIVLERNPAGDVRCPILPNG